MKGSFRRFVMLLLGFGLFGLPTYTQEFLLEVDPVATFFAYQCQFDRATNTAQVRASLIGADGLPIPREAYNVGVNVANTGVNISPALLRTTTVPERPPIYMILTLDITDTVPIESFVEAVRIGLVPQLQVDDRVALITFAEDVSPRTQFYTDKNRLLNEHMIDLRPGEGDNRLYDAIFDALTEFPPDIEARKVVLALTDSNRRDIEQTTLEEITGRSQREKVQVFTIGINSGQDQPDTVELEQLAAETGAYVWVWDDVFISRDGVRDGVAERLDEFITTLNSEILIEIGLEGQQPDPNGFISFEISIATNNDATLVDDVACPVERLFHSIQFLDDVPDGTIQGPVDVGVSVISDLDDEQTSIRFVVNDEIIQEGDATVFRFNPSDDPQQPGSYTVGAELVSNTGEVLATTGTAATFFVQADADLNIDGYDGQAAGETRFEVRADPDFVLPPVEFTISERVNPDVQRQLSPQPIPFENGSAVLVIPDIRAEVDRLFPDSNEEFYIVAARSTSPDENDPNLAVTNLFEVFIPRAPVEEPSQQPVLATVPVQINFDLVYWMLLLGLFVLNILAFRSIGRLRVRYRIAREDDIDLSPQLMTITVRRDGVRQAHTLTKKTMRVGRGSTENDINLGDDPNISRNHAVVMWRNGEWYFSNRKRRAIARVDGKRRIGYCWMKLEPITEIEIGNALLVFHSNAQQDISEFIKTNL